MARLSWPHGLPLQQSGTVIKFLDGSSLVTKQGGLHNNLGQWSNALMASLSWPDGLPLIQSGIVVTLFDGSSLVTWQGCLLWQSGRVIKLFDGWSLMARRVGLLIFLRRKVPGQTGARTRDLRQHRLALNTNALTLLILKNNTLGQWSSSLMAGL
jgi:hypothetical protein